MTESVCDYNGTGVKGIINMNIFASFFYSWNK